MGRALLVDATSVFAFQQYLKQHDYAVQGNINYGALLDALRRRRDRAAANGPPPRDRVSGAAHDADGKVRVHTLAKEIGFSSKDIIDKCRLEEIEIPNHMFVLSPGLEATIREWFTEGDQPPFEKMFAFVAINPQHEGQQKFCAYLRAQGFSVDETDFRDAFVVPNRESTYQRLSTRLTYVAGMLTSPFDGQGNRRAIPHLVVVSDAFDVYFPLLDYVQNRRGAATIAFFRRGMEDRWQRAGLFDRDSPIKFCDLSDDAKAIVGADLASSLGAKEGGKGLADFTL